jgi:hypothetical protein
MGCSDESNSGAGVGWLRRAWDGVIERGQVQSVCRELVELHRATSAQYPELRGERLYAQIIARFTRCDLAQAQAVLNHVEESFAQWPVVREVLFRDVVLYLVLSRSLTPAAGPSDSKTDFTNLVNAAVPADL